MTLAPAVAQAHGVSLQQMMHSCLQSAAYQAYAEQHPQMLQPQHVGWLLGRLRSCGPLAPDLYKQYYTCPDPRWSCNIHGACQRPARLLCKSTGEADRHWVLHQVELSCSPCKPVEAQSKGPRAWSADDCNGMLCSRNILVEAAPEQMQSHHGPCTWTCTMTKECRYAPCIN